MAAVAGILNHLEMVRRTKSSGGGQVESESESGENELHCEIEMWFVLELKLLDDNALGQEQRWVL